MKQIIEETVSWDAIGEHDRSEYAYSLEKALISKDGHSLTISLGLNFIIPFSDLEILRQEIEHKMPGITDVRFAFSYRDMVLTEREIIKLFIPYAAEEAGGDHAAIWEKIQNEFALSDGASAVFQDIIAVKPAGKTQKKYKRQGNILKTVSGEATELNRITASSGTVIVEGELYKKESKAMKGGRILAILFITDKTTSACAKAFLTAANWKELDGKVNKGDFVKIQGATEYDKFEEATVITMNAVEKCRKHVREDNSERKRVELHAHTRMSAMDGLNDTEDMIKLAASWNHRAVAITDHGVIQAFPDAARAVKNNKLDIKIIYGVEGYYFDDEGRRNEDGSIDFKTPQTSHIIILARTREGLLNLYKLISISHLEYFYRKPRIPKSVLAAHREGLLIGSACQAGEVYRSVLEKKDDKDIEKLIEFYDYLEIQPLINNQFLIDNGTVSGIEELKENNIRIVELSAKTGKPVVATCDAHYSNPEDAIYRDILLAGQGYKDVEADKGLFLRTTGEMLEEFSYLGRESAFEVVVKAPCMIADMVGNIEPVPTKKYPPKIENAEGILRERCMERAWSKYGKPLPKEVEDRLLRELGSIINNGYAVMYVSAEMLVRKSLDDGYLVGSRGSVGSSLAATMAGITEVNPLPAHYICPNCKYFEWGDREKYECGADMEQKDCPKCGTDLGRDGFTIPFETFLGFEGDKEPDIDLNFAGEYQVLAHKYVEEIFGGNNVFRAGTIGKIQEKTAYGFVMKYFEERGVPINKWEADRLSIILSGVRRTTGQHPGGIIIVPEGHEIYEFCPVQRPADKAEADVVTTHFDYHAIDKNLFKLDILGHDAPSMLRHLQAMTDVDPRSLPLKDAKVSSIFNGVSGLDIKDPQYRFTHGSYGIPEFGTRFVRQMLDDIKPEKIADLVKISGFSHGTNVWLNNALDYLKSGVATMNDIISTRDDIMSYLILKGLPNKAAFNIMERVRNGNGVSDEEAELMLQNSVPEWYIESCRKIKYMFPRAHAAAYVMMAYRIAYYKVYHPTAFYAVYFTAKVDDFDADTILKGPAAITDKITEIEAKGKAATQKEEDEVTVLEVAYEMYARGFKFLPANIERSLAFRFTVYDGKVLLPLRALSGMGETAARTIAEEYEKKPFETVDELKERTRANKTVIEALREHGALDGLPESAQLCLF